MDIETAREQGGRALLINIWCAKTSGAPMHLPTLQKYILPFIAKGGSGLIYGLDREGNTAYFRRASNPRYCRR
jgi:hypothetical protein